MNPALDIMFGRSASVAPTTYVEDVFSAYTYTANGSSQVTVTNGVDLSANGGLVVTKCRSNTTPPVFFDSARGLANFLKSDSTNPALDGTDEFGSFTTTGYTVPYNTITGNTNFSTRTYVGWTFRKAAKFFDVVTYTGTGAAQNIAHSLGSVPGMIIVKAFSTTGTWIVYHGSLPTPETNGLQLNSTAQMQGPGVTGYWNSTLPTSTQFTVNTNAGVNANGVTYVAYLFAHDTASTGMVQCGTYNAASAGTVNLGWEPQAIWFKDANAVGDWKMLDSSRGWAVQNPQIVLKANSSAAEATENWAVTPTATGFAYGAASNTFIYMAIRRPMKTPTSGTDVYQAIARTGNATAATAITGVGFAPDVVFSHDRSGVGYGMVNDRLRGAAQYLTTIYTDAEASSSNVVTSFDMDGITVGSGGGYNASATNYINWFFKRAPGFCDVVCYTGTGTAGQDVAHGLKVQPELLIVKKRSGTSGWPVVSKLASGLYAFWSETGLNGTSAASGSALNGSSLYTTTTFNTGVFGNSGTEYDVSGQTYVAYLFATLAGISKVGSYTGNGTSQTINCGFSAGARFILIKQATGAASDWQVFDTVRGIVAGSDARLRMNTTNAEDSADNIDPDGSGFIVNQTGNNCNANGETYVFLAIA